MWQDAVIGTGEMAERIRNNDWSRTALGSIDTWSSTLLTCVNMMLAVPTPIQIFWGREMVTFYNDPLIPILTHKHPQALGLPARDVWAEVWSNVGAQLEAVMEEGHSYAYRDLPLEMLNNGKLEQGYYTFSYSPIREGATGQIVGLLNISQNVTGIVEAQRSLRRSERRFRSLIHDSSVGIAIGSTSGELTYLNPALMKMLEYTREDLADGSIRWDQLTPARYAEADGHAIEQLNTVGVAEPYEKAYLSKSGEPIPLLIGASVIPADEEFGGGGDIAVFATDLRKQKRAEGALLQSEKLIAVGKLASSISHEINNPLEAITNLLFLVATDPSLSQSARDFLATADRELARVSWVVSQTLRFHRQSTRPMRVSPDELLDEVLQLYMARAGNFNIELVRESGHDVQLTCYEGDIRQVLNNLVGNAVDAMRSEGGRLSVRTRRCQRSSTGAAGVLITVADTGTGMDDATRLNIFNAFFTTKGIHGTGLGLWISCRIVHKHRGYIRVYSSKRPETHGTVFQLWLPVELAASAYEEWHNTQVDSDDPKLTGASEKRKGAC